MRVFRKSVMLAVAVAATLFYGVTAANASVIHFVSGTKDCRQTQQRVQAYATAKFHVKVSVGSVSDFETSVDPNKTLLVTVDSGSPQSPWSAESSHGLKSYGAVCV